MNEWVDAQIRIAALTMATDGELCQMFGLTPEKLGQYRKTIDRARTEGIVTLRLERAKATKRPTAPKVQGV